MMQVTQSTKNRLDEIQRRLEKSGVVSIHLFFNPVSIGRLTEEAASHVADFFEQFLKGKVRKIPALERDPKSYKELA
jgi:hypothetical protein